MIAYYFEAVRLSLPIIALAMVSIAPVGFAILRLGSMGPGQSLRGFLPLYAAAIASGLLSLYALWPFLTDTVPEPRRSTEGLIYLIVPAYAAVTMLATWVVSHGVLSVADRTPLHSYLDRAVNRRWLYLPIALFVVPATGILMLFARQAEWFVASKSPCPPALHYLAERTQQDTRRGWSVYLFFRENRRLPEAILWRMATAKDADLRGRAAFHPRATPEMLRTLEADPSPWVRDSARKALERAKRNGP